MTGQNSAEISPGDFDLPSVDSSMSMKIYNRLLDVNERAGNGSVLPIYPAFDGRAPQKTNFVRFRYTESSFIPVVVSPPPEQCPPPQSPVDYLRSQRDLVALDPTRVTYGATDVPGGFFPAYSIGQDTRTPEGQDFHGRIVSLSPLTGSRRKQ